MFPIEKLRSSKIHRLQGTYVYVSACVCVYHEKGLDLSK